MSECSTLATSIGRSCPIHPSVIQPGQFRCDLARAEAAEAAIARVRELAEQRIEDVRGFMAPATLSAHEVLDALRGESDE